MNRKICAQTYALQCTSLQLLLVMVMVLFAKPIQAQDVTRLAIINPNLNQEKEISSFSYSLTSTIARGLHELSPYFGAINIGVNYKKPKWKRTAFYTLISANRPLESEAPEPEIYGLQNINVGMNYQIGKWGTWNISNNTSLTLPTSERSRRSSHNGSISNQMAASNRWRSLGFLGFAGLNLSHFTYDDADVYGFRVNSPIGLSLGTQITYFLQPWISPYIGGRLTSFYNYQGVVKFYEQLRLGTLFSINQKLRVNVSYQWQDEIVTNNPFLYEDLSSWSGSLIYSF